MKQREKSHGDTVPAKTGACELFGTHLHRAHGPQQGADVELVQNCRTCSPHRVKETTMAVVSRTGEKGLAEFLSARLWTLS